VANRRPVLPPADASADDDAIVLSHALAPPPVMLVISGPSGVGKDEVVKGLQSRHVPFHFVVTATTRPQRENEVDGRDYHFVSVATFAEMIEHDDLLEHAVVYGDYKGIPKQQVRAALASGQDVVLRIDVQGAQTIRGLIPATVTVFLIAESMTELERRLRERKSEPPDLLKMRIATARQEVKRATEFDYIVVNRRDRLDETVDTILAIVTAEKHRAQRQAVTL
jgi:guanylate kinase